MNDGIESSNDELEEIEALVQRRRRAGEADKGRVRRAWQEAEQRLQALLEAGNEDLRVLRLHAELASRRSDWNRAIARWQRVIEAADEPVPRARARLAAAYRAAGQLGAARETLKEARREGLKKQVFERARSRLLDQRAELRRRDWGVELVSSLKAGEQRRFRKLFRRWLESGLDDDRELSPAQRKALRRLADELIGVWRQGEQMSGWRLPGLPRLIRMARTMRSMVGGRTHVESDSGIEAPPVILSCGFGWSGSGAVTDWLADLEGVELSLGRGEMHWFRSSYGYSAEDAVSCLSTDPAAWHEAVVGFCLVHLFGVEAFADEGEAESLPVTERTRRVRKLRDRAPVWDLLADETAFLGFIKDVRRLLAALAAIRPHALDAPEEAEACFREFFARLISRATPKGGVCLLNNCIKAFQVELVRLLPETRVVAVTRDPRDMYVSRAWESPGGAMPVDEFISGLRGRYRAWERARRNPDMRGRLIELRFEDFVRDEAVRDRLGGELGVAERGTRKKRRFRPDRSAANIGIHRQWECQEDIARIARAFPERLVDEGG